MAKTLDSSYARLSFRDREPGDKGDTIPDATLLAGCKKGAKPSLNALKAYYASNQMLYCVRVGFWDKPSGVDPIEYARYFSGVAKITRKVAEHCFDVGFISNEMADAAVEQSLFYLGVKVPHFRPCSKGENVRVVLFHSLQPLYSTLISNLSSCLDYVNVGVSYFLNWNPLKGSLTFVATVQ
ncbi:hypothetical protein DSO57_1004029 [Entomophthora muscae]|uniref:Uncharacterized protein n=1 Tax=Entomophthora muscae TaxID=34485 RepID=A0ACC2T7Z0_9FUNG|nr:hypothetical protein DSO57_1004029 [Entomophthora muscae]